MKRSLDSTSVPRNVLWHMRNGNLSLFLAVEGKVTAYLSASLRKKLEIRLLSFPRRGR